MRPGDTIPVVQKEGQLQYNNATNTSFGAPPVLILRVGDFFHSKIIPDNLQLTYENLDINPEGIGIQPMIANVTLSFKFVGGHGLASAVDKLQNALTFNYYANTEMYDDRSDVTDTSYQVLDKEFLDYFNIQIPQPTVNSVPNLNGQSNNQTIGVITSATTTTSGETGQINYQGYMNGFILSTQTYFTNVLNKNKEVFTQYNNGIRQFWTTDRDYQNGKTLINSSDVPLFGKPKNIEKKIDSLFSDFIKDINNDEEGLIVFLKGTPDNPKNFSSKVIRALKDSYITYLKSKKSNFESSLTQITQSFITIEQNLINNIAKNNVVTFGLISPVSGTDGLQQKNGFVKLYVTSGTSNTYDKTNADTLVELRNDSLKIFTQIKNFRDDTEKVVTFNGYSGVLVYGNQKIPTNQVFSVFSKDTTFQNDLSFQRSYCILNQDIIDNVNYETFKKQILGSLITNTSLFSSGPDANELQAQFDAYWKTSAKPKFVDENTITTLFFNEVEKNTLKNYLIFKPFDGAEVKKYELTFTTYQGPAETAIKDEREKLIKSLGVSQNEYKTFDNWADITNGSLVICKVKLN
jgi:hypothetical protein